MKKFCTVLSVVVILVLILSLSPVPAFSERYSTPKFFPTMGYCTGDSVRLRSRPGTGNNSQIIGRADKSDRLIVLGRTNFNGDIWYEIENPFPGISGLGINDTLWISGQYIVSPWSEYEQRDPVKRLVMLLNQEFGSTPDRSRILLGHPISHEDNFFEWDGLSISYSNNVLDSVHVNDGSWAFGEIKLGDDFSKVERLLGNPAERNDYSITYHVTNDLEVLEFGSDSGRNIIDSMSYMNYSGSN